MESDRGPNKQFRKARKALMDGMRAGEHIPERERCQHSPYIAAGKNIFSMLLKAFAESNGIYEEIHPNVEKHNTTLMDSVRKVARKKKSPMKKVVRCYICSEVGHDQVLNFRLRIIRRQVHQKKMKQR